MVGFLAKARYEDNDHGQEEENVEAEVLPERVQDEDHGVGGIVPAPYLSPDQEIDRQAQQPAGHGRPEHMLDVVEEVGPGGDGRQVGDVGEGRHLVAEIGAGDDGPRGQPQRHPQPHGDPDKGDAHGPDRPPGCSRGQRRDGADEAGRDQEELGRDELEAVVDDHRDGPAGHPGADEDSDQSMIRMAGIALWMLSTMPCCMSSQRNLRRTPRQPVRKAAATRRTWGLIL